MIKLTDLIPVSSGLQYHIDNKIPLHENIYRYSSDKFVELYGECRRLFTEGKIELTSIDREILSETEIGEFGLYEGLKVPLDLPLIVEAQYKGRNVELNKPRRGGPKKFFVYTKNPKTGKVIKVNFGATDGGQNLAVKLDDPKRRKAFSDRHNCDQKTDKTKPGYWACRLTRYAKVLGMKKNYPGYW
jgi:hypothetical protein